MENKIIATGFNLFNDNYSIRYEDNIIKFFDKSMSGIDDDLIVNYETNELDYVIDNIKKMDFENGNAGVIKSNQELILPMYQYLLKVNESKETAKEIIEDLFNTLKEDYDQQSKEWEEKNRQILDYENNYDFKDIGVSKYYFQSEKRFYYFDSKPKNPERELKGLFSLNSITRYNDIAGTSERKFIITYWNGIEDKLITSPKLTKKELINYLDQQDVFICDKKEIEKILGDIITFTKTKDDLTIVNEVINKGYFLDLEEDKILENTNIKDFHPTYEQTHKALKVLLELITTDNYKRDMNVALTFKMMLHMPFHWIIKNIGYDGGDNIRGLVSNGWKRSNKTTSQEISLWFYGECPMDHDSSMDSIASYADKISESTLPTIIDEGYNILSKTNSSTILKRQITNKRIRSVMGGSNYNERQPKYAMSTPAFNCNETITDIIKDGLVRRYLLLRYTQDMQISREKAKEFELKYKHRSPESPLKILGCIGAEFREYISPLILERKTNEKSNRLIDLDSLVNDFFSELLAKHNMTATEFNDELLTSDVEEMIMKGSHYNLKEDLVTKLNNEFRKIQNRAIYGKYYSIEDFIAAATKGGFNWLHYQTNNKQFIIDLKKFTDQAEKLTNQSSLTPEYLLSELGISLGEDEEGNPVQPSRIKVGEKQVYNAIRISDEDLTNKIFNIDISINDVEVMELEDKT